MSAFTQPRAAFSANRVEGCAPLIVQFKDESTGNPGSWKWDLGNGTVSFLQNPAATYFNPGTYTVKLVVSNGAQTDSVIKTKYISVFPTPSVNFSASDSNGCYPLLVQFSDFSRPGDGSIESWLWDFGDGDTSSSQNPQHTYTAAGSYNVSLQVKNSRGCIQSNTRLNYIKLSNGVLAGFNVSGTLSCHPPSTIQFNNTSTGTGALTFEWFFGDGSTSNQLNPSHSYTSAGVYSVRLIARNSSGCIDSIIVNNAVTIGTVNASFTSPSSICANQLFQLNNNSSPTPINSTWIFGDGSISNTFQPTKSFTIPGTYSIKLISDFGACKDSVSKSIEIIAKPLSQITSSNRRSCKYPLTVNFTGISTAAISYKWDFGDGDSSVEKNPSHTYNAYGKFTVKLITINAAGCTDTLTNPDYILIQRPEVALILNQEEGCVPYTYAPIFTTASGDSLISFKWDFGDGATSNESKPIHIYNRPGIYTVKLFYTTLEGCSDSLVIPNAVRVGFKPISNFIATPNIACAFRPISFQDRSTGAVADRWLWRFGDGGTSQQKDPTHIYQDTGWFNVTLIVWNNGCSDSLEIPRYIYIRPPIAKFRDSSVCDSKFTRWFIDQSIGATEWYWDFGDGSTGIGSSPIHNYTQAGSYNVTLTVKNDTCEHRTTRQVLIVSEIPQFDANDTNVCKGKPVTFSSMSGDRTNITSYKWDFGDGTNGIGDSIQHSYSKTGKFTIRLIIEDVNGCADTLIKPFYLNVTGPTAAFKSSTPAVCNNTPVQFIDSSFSDGVHPIKKWLWNYGDGFVDSLSTPPFQHSFDSAGLFTITLTVEDSIGCEDRFQRSSYLLISKPNSLFVSPDTLSCPNQPIRFINQTTGNGPINYLWNFDNNLPSSAVHPITIYTNEGNYSIKLLATDKFGCKDSISRPAYITIKKPKAKFSLSDSVATCPPLVINFINQSENYIRFQWDFGDGTKSVLNNPVHFYTYPGNYRAVLRIFSAGGCIDSMERNISVRGPQGNFRYNKTAGCEPTGILFTGITKDTVSFVWDFDDGTVNQTADSIITHNYNRRGFYLPKMILKDPQGCQVSIPGIDTVKIYGIDPKFKVQEFNLCDSGLVVFSDSSSSNDRIISYQWNFGDGSISAEKTPSHFYRQPGNYEVLLRVTTQFGCMDSTQLPVPLTIAKTPEIDILANPNGCIPANEKFEASIVSIDSSAHQWKWDFGNGTQSNQQTPPPVIYNIAGTYFVSLIVKNDAGCADTVVRRFTAFPLPLTNAGVDQTICFGTSTNLNATGADSYIWLPSNSLSCSNCSNPTVRPDSTILLRVEGKNIYGCSRTDSVLIQVQLPFTVSVVKGDTLCVGETKQLFASGADFYVWSPADGLDNPNKARPFATPSLTTLYRVIGLDKYGCFADTGFVPLQVYPYPTVNAGPDQTIQVGNSVVLKSVISADVTGIQWSPSTGLSCISCSTPIATPRETTNYRVEVRNLGGCLSKDDVTVFVFCDNSNLFVPNTFSPNADGNNDVFYPRGKGLFSIKTFRIFNRWGELMFEKSNFSPNDASKGWDGTHLGKASSQDVYVYTIEVMCNNQTILRYGGNVALIR